MNALRKPRLNAFNKSPLNALQWFQPRRETPPPPHSRRRKHRKPTPDNQSEGGQSRYRLVQTLDCASDHWNLRAVSRIKNGWSRTVSKLKAGSR
jgi:hypothetical protein